MTETSETPNTPPADEPYEGLSAESRGGDDRKSEVNPADSPVPSNPPVDEDALRKGEDNLDSVKPY